MTTFFVALAVVLICLVALGALVKTNPRGAVSSFEHLIEGSVGVAAVLYGLALLYGTTRSTNLAAVADPPMARLLVRSRSAWRCSCWVSAPRSASSRCAAVGRAGCRQRSPRARPGSSWR